MYQLLKFLPLLLMFSCSGPPPPLTLSDGKIYDATHLGNIGKIAFMTDWVSHDEFSEADHLQEVNLQATTELNGRMYLNKTITSYLNDLAPDQPVYDLCATGSFQFTFLVDDEPIYVYNLPTGAGSCDFKNEETIYGIPFRGIKELDHWGRFLWLKFWKLGDGESALETGNHQLKIEVRPYWDGEEFLTGPLIASGELRITNGEETPLSPEAVNLQPIAPTTAFPINTDAFDPAPIERINRRIATGSYEEVTSLVVLQGGALLVEEYFNGANRETIHDTRSVGKSFAGTLLGQAIADGYIQSIQQPLSDFYDFTQYQNPAPAKPATTLEDLLTMCAPFAANDDDLSSVGNEENMYPTKDWVRFTLDLPARPTDNWQYFSAGAVVLGDIIHRSVPGGLVAYAQQRLFEPLGITDQQWQYTPTGVGNTAGSLGMSSLSYAAFGQLYLEQDEATLPASWKEKSLEPLVPRQDEKQGHYGYLLWHDVLEVDGKLFEVIAASGNGGNKIAILPELDAVIVLTATAYGKPTGHFQAEQILKEVIQALPATTGATALPE